MPCLGKKIFAPVSLLNVVIVIQRVGVHETDISLQSVVWLRCVYISLYFVFLLVF